MENRTYSTEGIILSRKNYGEADRILTIFSKHYGKIRVIAKGVRRLTSKKRGSLEVFTHDRFFLARGRNMDVVTDVEIKNPFDEWRADLIKVGVAYHLCEVVDRLTAEHQEHKEINDLLIESFSSLGGTDYWQLNALIQSFKIKILEELGFIEKNKPAPENLNNFIENLLGSPLRTRKFLKAIA